MKVRWTEGGLRLRITPTELAALERGEPVGETLAVLGGGWQVTLLPNAVVSAVRGDGGGAVTFALSSADVSRLSDPESEGVYFERDGFAFYVEKDFPCVHPRASELTAPETETFAPPAGFDERKA